MEFVLFNVKLLLKTVSYAKDQIASVSTSFFQGKILVVTNLITRFVLQLSTYTCNTKNLLV